MLTIFTTAKPFKGLTRIHQYNAIRSWKSLDPDIEVILFGSGEGYADAARDLGISHMQDVRTNAQGTPRLDSMIEIARERGRHQRMAYVNCDIVMMADVALLKAAFRWDRCLVVGRRTNVAFDTELVWTDGSALHQLKEAVAKRGELQNGWAIDYFMYCGDIWKDMPEMVVGRAGYDNWLIYRSRTHGVPVVDATRVITAVHQNHEYGHVPGGRELVYHGPEAEKNKALAGGVSGLWTIMDADWRLLPGGLERNWANDDAGRSAEIFQLRHTDKRFLSGALVHTCITIFYELLIRCQKAGHGDVKPLARYPLWILMKLAGRRKYQRSRN